MLETIPHDRFHRQGADLIYRATIPLYHALAGLALQVRMLDNKVIDVPVSRIITPGHSISVECLGLPDPMAGPSGRGNLVIETQLLFPDELSQPQKMLLKAALYLPKEKQNCDAVKDFQRAFEDPLEGWQTAVLKD